MTEMFGAESAVTFFEDGEVLHWAVFTPSQVHPGYVDLSVGTNVGGYTELKRPIRNDPDVVAMWVRVLGFPANAKLDWSPCRHPRPSQSLASTRSRSSHENTVPSCSEDCTYFVLAPELGRVKIGRTSNIGSRLNSLRTGSPCLLTLLAVTMEHEEEAMHERFRGLRLHGEWFKAEPELMEFISSLGSTEE